VNENNTSVVILLSTYNGEKYLQEQIDSLSSQTHKNIKILARDDYSDDNSLLILESNDIEVIPVEENVGAKKSFSLLLEYALKNTECKYFMFCDQDDVWKSTKVEKTLSKIQELEQEFKDTPLLVHTDLEVVDKSLNLLSESMWSYEYILPQYNSLNRLLMQNTITGCTVMINKALAQKSSIPNEAIMHDWWIGLVASYFGKIDYIQESTLQYRQHSTNTIGARGFELNITKHLLELLRSYVFQDKSSLEKMQIKIEQARVFLEIFEDELDDLTKSMLQELITIEQKTFWQRRKILLKYKLLKQGLIRNIGMFLKI